MSSSEPPHAVHARDLVVIGASAGGVEALKQLVGGLPANLPAAVCVVLHLAPSSASALAGILGRAGDLTCRTAENGEPLVLGEVLVAPPDHHLVVDDGHVWLDAGPRENGHRPSVDTLFRSAANAREGSVVGVVLSGTRDDGAAGLAAIKARGGAAVVQDPADALYAGMPASAIAHVAVDAVAPTALVADAVTALVHGHALPSGVRGTSPGAGGPGTGSPLTVVCPRCGGVLTEQARRDVPGWTCHVGHTYGPGSLVEAQGRAVEAALWTALRSLDDRAELLRRMGERAAANDQPRSASAFTSQADAVQQQADLLRSVVRDAAAAAHGAFPETEIDARLKAGDAV